jgi:hypothetical protein
MKLVCIIEGLDQQGQLVVIQSKPYHLSILDVKSILVTEFPLVVSFRVTYSLLG